MMKLPARPPMVRVLLALSILGLLVAFGLRFVVDETLRKALPAALNGIVIPDAKPLEIFELTDHNGKTFNLDRLKGPWSFLFFGYTHCPDVCPVAMGLLAEVFERLKVRPEILKGTQGVFISVDPTRDSAATLKSYVPYFNPGFIGVTGSQGNVLGLTRQVGAAYQISPDEKHDGNYLVSHSSAFFLIDPEGRLYAIFQPQFHDGAAITEKYLLIRDLTDKQKRKNP